MNDPVHNLDKGETVAEMFSGYANMVYPMLDKASIQYVETEKAFYAGALCLFNWMMVQLDSDEEPTEADLDRVSKIDEEIRAFFTNLMPNLMKGVE